MGTGQPRTLAEVLGPLLAGLSVERRAAFLLQPAWARVVGSALARHAILSSFDGGRLVVACDSGALAHELSARRDELRSQLNAELRGQSVLALEVRGP